MFSLFNGIYDSYLAPSQLNLLIVGGENSGKTALLERLKVTEIPSRPKNKNQKERFGAATAEGQPDVTVRDALIESGALEKQNRRNRSRTSSLRSWGEKNFSNDNIFNASLNNYNKQFSERSVLSTKATSGTAAVDNHDSNIQDNKNNSGNIRDTDHVIVVTERRKSRFTRICPAPKRYSKSTENEQDEEELMVVAERNANDNSNSNNTNKKNSNNAKDSLRLNDDEEESKRLLIRGDDDDNDDGNSSFFNKSFFREDSFPQSNIDEPTAATTAVTASIPKRVRCHSKEFDIDSLDLIMDGGRRSSMQDIMLDNNDDNNPESEEKAKKKEAVQLRDELTNKLQPQNQEQQQQHHNCGPPLLQATTEEYDLKTTSKMLPLRMIRPTIGTNLAKINMYGAKCHIFDVGGKLQNLWERYYDDCDAVIFCWKLGDDSEKSQQQHDDDDDDDTEEKRDPRSIYKQQQKLLNEVRKSIPDDVPFLIFGHVFGNANVDVVDRMYTTDLLLPRYHNPMTGFCCGSAKTGAGILSSIEWLIPLAKRQQRERINSNEGGGKDL